MFRAQRVFASSVEGRFKPRPTCQLRHLWATANRLSMPAKLQGSFKTNERPIKTTLTDSATFEEDQQIHGLISSLPLVRYLRSTSHSSTIAAGQPKYTELHLHSKIHPSAVSTHLVGGSLLGQNKLPMRPQLFVRDGPTVRMIATCYIGSQLCGHPGYVHGGLPFVLFDDLFARCASMTFNSGVGMTANMDLQFRKPSIPDRVYIVRAEAMKREGRKVWLSGSMRCLDSFTAEQMAAKPAATGDGLSVEEEQGSLVVEASSLFVEPKFASAMVPLFQNE